MAGQLKAKYKTEVIKAMMASGHYQNIMQVPKLEKIVINMAVHADAERDTIKHVARITGLAVHEMLDFGLSMPANAVTLALLAGAAAPRSPWPGHQAGWPMSAVSDGTRNIDMTNADSRMPTATEKPIC